MDPTAEASGCTSSLVMVGHVVAPKEPAFTGTDREVLPDLKSGHLISSLQQRSASATSFVLGVSSV